VNQAADDTLYAEALDEQVGLRDAAFGGPPGGSDLVIAGLAVAVATGAAVIVGTGGVADQPTALATVLAANVATLAVAGLLWRHGRPSSLLGPLLLLEALFLGLSSLAGSSHPGLYLTGILAGWAGTIGITWLLVAFPSGRPRGAAWSVLALAFAAFALGELPVILTSPTIHILSVVGRCAGACPANPAQLVDAPRAAESLRDLRTGLEVAWGVGAVAYMVLHFSGATRPRRRILAPLYMAMIPFAVAFAASAIVSEAAGVRLGFASEAIFVATRIVAPLGFIGALLLARSYAGGALAFMTARLVGHPTVAAVEQLVRRVLDDPQARLAFWLPRGRKYVDRHGKPVTLHASDEGASWRSFGGGAEPVLAIVHDRALSDEIELVEAVGAAAMLAFENRRLHQDLLDSVHALRASQQRLVRASTVERRKIERDLHDGVQQKLVALRIHLELAREFAEDESGLGARLAALGSDFDEAIEELRSIAHGIYPPLLAEEGLGAALREVARRSTVPLTVGVEDVGRLPEDCETAIYYCCLEALQNVAKHAGEDAVASLRVWRDRRAIHFSVADDGVGFAQHLPSRSDVGLTNMSDRIGAVGGSLAIRSAPGEGTTVEGWVAVRAADRARNDPAPV
jgi:signal transduction histidine kinase